VYGGAQISAGAVAKMALRAEIVHT
jgi:hypothetical protein